MLTRVLEAINNSDGAIDLRALSRQLKVEPSALEGMIQHWVAKGRLVDATAADADPSECSSCGPMCGGDEPCPFVIAAPRTVSVVAKRTQDP